MHFGQASTEDLRALGLGFRDKRVYETTKMFLNKEITLEELKSEKETLVLRDKLMTLPRGWWKGCRLYFAFLTKEVRRISCGCLGKTCHERAIY